MNLNEIYTMYPFVSIIVVTKNEEKHIKDCLDSLEILDYPKEKYEIIVIDGGSTDMTCEIVNKYPVNLLLDKEGTLANSRNIGIRISKGDYIASTDADCVVKEDWLKILVNAIQTAPDNVVAAGGPNLVFENEYPFAKLIGYMQETFLGSGGAPQSYKIKKNKYVYGIPNCNVLYKRNKLIEINGFDSSLNMGEDAEINYRFTKKGYKYLFIPEAVVWHHRVKNVKKFVQKMYIYGKGMGRLTRMKKIVRWYSFLPTLSIFTLLFAYPLIKLFPIVLYVYIFGFVVYAAGLLISTVQVFYRNYKKIEVILILLLLPLQHFSYGIGFLKGIIGGK